MDVLSPFSKLLEKVYDFLSRQTFAGLTSALLANIVLFAIFDNVHSNLLRKRHPENRVFDHFMEVVEASLPCRAMSSEFARELDRIASALTNELARRRALRVKFDEQRQVFQLTLAAYQLRYSTVIIYKTPGWHEVTRDGLFSGEVYLRGTGVVTCQRAVSMAESLVTDLIN